MKIAVIEYASDEAVPPDVCVGPEREVLWAAAVAMHEYMGRDLTQYADTLDEAGDPHDLHLLVELYRWHYLVHDSHTIPWVTFYEVDGDEVCAQPDEVMNRRLILPGVVL